MAGATMLALDSSPQRPYNPIMPLTFEALLQNALGLPEDLRLALAYRLLVSVDLELTLGAEEAWENEIRDRILRFDLSESRPVPASDVFAAMREIAPDV